MNYNEFHLPRIVLEIITNPRRSSFFQKKNSLSVTLMHEVYS